MKKKLKVPIILIIIIAILIFICYKIYSKSEKLKQEHKEFANDNPFILNDTLNNVLQDDINDDLDDDTELPVLKVKEEKNDNQEQNITNKEEDLNKSDKPKVNIDVDSVIMNENVITDDEFFDDFFGDE